jgi:hypothetical protein
MRVDRAVGRNGMDLSGSIERAKAKSPEKPLQAGGSLSIEQLFKRFYKGISMFISRFKVNNTGSVPLIPPDSSYLAIGPILSILAIRPILIIQKEDENE